MSKLMARSGNIKISKFSMTIVNMGFPIMCHACNGAGAKHSTSCCRSYVDDGEGGPECCGDPGLEPCFRCEGEGILIHRGKL